MNVENVGLGVEPLTFDHYSNGLITHQQQQQQQQQQQTSSSSFDLDEVTSRMSTTTKIPIVSPPIIDLDQRLHRLVVFAFFFLFLVLALVLMSKIYKTVQLLKYRNKHFGYYINPKYETILVNLNRQIRSGSRTLAHNYFKKRQFVRVRKYEDDDNEGEDDIEKQRETATNRIENDENSDSTSSTTKCNMIWDGGYVNEVFELTESSEIDSSRRSSQETIHHNNNNEEDDDNDEDEKEKVCKKAIVQNLIKNGGRFRSSFNYKRLVSNGKTKTKTKKSQISRKVLSMKRARSKISSYIAKKLLSDRVSSKSKRPTTTTTTKQGQSSSLTIITSEEPSTTTTSRPSMLEFDLPVILVTDTSSMNTIIIDLDEDDEFR